MANHVLLITLTTVFVFTANVQSHDHGGGQTATSSHTTQQPTHSSNKMGAKNTEPVMQMICPITNNIVDKRTSVTWEGNEHFTPKRVYFCCRDCVVKFNKEPEHYVRKLRAMNQSVENVFENKEEQTNQIDNTTKRREQ